MSENEPIKLTFDELHSATHAVTSLSEDEIRELLPMVDKLFRDARRIRISLPRLKHE